METTATTRAEGVAAEMEAARELHLADPAVLVNEIEALREMVASDWYHADKATIAKLIGTLAWRARKVAAKHTGCVEAAS